MKAPTVSPQIEEEIRQHAFGQIRRMREAVGRLIVRDGIALRYEPLRNWAKGDYTFRVHSRVCWRCHRQCAGPHWDSPVGEGEEIVMVHTHPTGAAWPSDADMRGAHSNWIGVPYAIFLMEPGRFYSEGGGEETGTLKFFRLNLDRKTCVELHA